MQYSFITRVVTTLLAVITLASALATQKPLNNNAKVLLNLHDLQTEYRMRMEEHHNVMKDYTDHLEQVFDSLTKILDLELSDNDTLFNMPNLEAVEVLDKVLSQILVKLEGGAAMLEDAKGVLEDIKTEIKHLETWSQGFKSRVGKAQREFDGKKGRAILKESRV